MSGGGEARLSFLIPLVGFLVLAGFATLALVATLSGERDVSQLPSAMLGKPAPKAPLPNLTNGGGAVSGAGFAPQSPYESHKKHACEPLLQSPQNQSLW